MGARRVLNNAFHEALRSIKDDERTFAASRYEASTVQRFRALRGAGTSAPAS